MEWNLPKQQGRSTCKFCDNCTSEFLLGYPRFITFNKLYNFELELSLIVQVVVSGELAENLLFKNFHRKFRYPFRSINLFSILCQFPETVQF